MAPETPTLPACLPDEIRDLKAHYVSGLANLARDFFVPCLEHCASYKRATGSFSSTALIHWARVLPRLAHAEVIPIQLIISPELNLEDLDALRRCVTPKDRTKLLQQIGDQVVLKALDFAGAPHDVELRLQLFAWMVATGRLNLRFAYLKEHDLPGIFHSKIGIFGFPSGEKVAFTGSANETLSGYSRNYESIDVFRSWIPSDTERVPAKEEEFDRAWSGRAQGLEVIPLSEAALRRVREISPMAPPRIHARPGPKADPRWRHQDEAVDRFLHERRGVLEMATGTGKTFTALKIWQALMESRDIDTLIVAADGTDLLNQWYEDLLGHLHTTEQFQTVYRHYDKHHQNDRFQLDPEHKILLVSRQALAAPLRHLSPQHAARTLLIHDEVHRLGSPGNRRDLAGLTTTIPYRLGLSATPQREYDEQGSAFIKEHVGPVIFQFDLEDAIRRGVLAPFQYYPIEYTPTAEDRKRVHEILAWAAAKEKQGRPLPPEQLWIQIARVYKTSQAKLPLFEKFIARYAELLRRCIIFVETREFGDLVLPIVHRHRPDFHVYFADEDSEVLRRFASGELECLITCHRLSEGIDIRNLETVILFSSARARLETIQRMGRSLRQDPSNPTKMAKVVDFIRQPGDPDDEETSDQERCVWLTELSRIRPEGAPA
jgi:superfamily II DNA or RNA helicase